jgi:hypothetical protein
MKWMRLNVTRVLGQKDVGQAEKEDYTEEALNRNGEYKNCFYFLQQRSVNSIGRVIFFSGYIKLDSINFNFR